MASPILVAAQAMTASPTPCPRLSLITFRRSRSANTTRGCDPSSWSAWPIRRSMTRRLGVEVTGSTPAWCRRVRCSSSWCTAMATRRVAKRQHRPLVGPGRDGVGNPHVEDADGLRRRRRHHRDRPAGREAPGDEGLRRPLPRRIVEAMGDDGGAAQGRHRRGEGGLDADLVAHVADRLGVVGRASDHPVPARRCRAGGWHPWPRGSCSRPGATMAARAASGSAPRAIRSTTSPWVVSSSVERRRSATSLTLTTTAPTRGSSSRFSATTSTGWLLPSVSTSRSSMGWCSPGRSAVSAKETAA